MKKLLLIGMMVIGGTVMNAGRAQDWTLTSANTNLIWNSLACSADGSQLIAGEEQGGVYLSADSGGTWTLSIPPGTNSTPISVACSADGRRLAAWDSAQGVIFTSTNAGVSWSANGVTSAMNSNALTGANPGSLAASADGAKLFVTTSDQILYASTNGGATWNAYPAPITNAVAIAASADGTQLIMAGNWTGIFSQAIFRSTNGGINWEMMGAPTNAEYFCLTSSADGTKLAAGATGTVYTSTNSGTTWTEDNIIPGWVSPIVSSANGSQLVAVARVNVVSLFGSGAIMTSMDSGATWDFPKSPLALWSGLAVSADGAKMFGAAYTSTGIRGNNKGGIYAAQTNLSPVLNTTRRGQNLVVSWTVPSTNYFLMENSQPSPEGWTYVYPAPTLNVTNLQWEVSVTTTNDHNFYRLDPLMAQPGVRFVTFDPPLPVNNAAVTTVSNQALDILPFDLNFDSTVDFNLTYTDEYAGPGEVTLLFNTPAQVMIKRLPTFFGPGAAAVPFGTLIGTNLNPLLDDQWSSGFTNDDATTLSLGNFAVPVIPAPRPIPFDAAIVVPIPIFPWPLVDGDIAGKTGVIGLEFYINGQPHYGYIDFDFRAGIQGVINGWAYQTEPGVPIAAVPVNAVAQP